MLAIFLQSSNVFSRLAKLLACLSLVAILMRPSHADGPADNNPNTVRRVPKLGIAPTPIQAAAIQNRLAQLDSHIQKIAEHPQAADVKILRRAIWSALNYQEFFDADDFNKVEKLFDLADLRLQALQAGKTDWQSQPGLTVLGYESKIDHSVQPYGLIIPASYRPEGERRFRLDVWFHGRGETLSELKFIDQRLTQRGSIAPADTIVLHPYGRYSNAFKFAGEVDVWEAIEDVKRRFRIDEDRIAVRGFSMGGAGCWQFAVHHPDFWFAANPGAGFSETPEFLKFFQKETLQPTWYERKLWHMYDCTDYAVNLYHCPTIAYSGEVDIQKQAADIMQKALAEQGLNLTHIIGPQTAHSIHPAAGQEIEQRLDELSRVGRNQFPHVIHFQTWTLKYNRVHWITIDELQEHWSRARLDAEIKSKSVMEISTLGINAFSIDMRPGKCPLDATRMPLLIIDGQQVIGLPIKTDRSLSCRMCQHDGKWQICDHHDDGLRKRHHLQGPIDDAFMDAFLIVRPTGKSRHQKVAEWVTAELEHAAVHWRQQFRGETRIKDDTQVTADDIANSNLILFGDPTSNTVLSRISDKLPLQWGAEEIQVGERTFTSDQHALVMIYPNPLNPHKYVVLNSGFTYREYDYLNNARQVPKLPDWAVIDLDTPPNSQRCGSVADADFFDEHWRLQLPAAQRIQAE